MESPDVSPDISPSETPSTRPPLHLPSEIISLILAHIPRTQSSQPTLWACTLVSRSFYHASIPLLYHRPYITPNNFSLFVRTICPSKNAHIIPTPLSPLVHRLDMGALVHNSSKSLTARLLGRLKGNIQQFVAPQASFAINSFAALGKCREMRLLDLSLISASISNKLLFQTLSHLPNLHTLFFPRSSALDALETVSAPYVWPPKLSALHLAGGINDNFLWTHMGTLPETLRTLSIQHCSTIHAPSILHVLELLGKQLTHLTLRHPLPHLYPTSLDGLLLLCPLLLALRVSADFISPALFTAPNIPPSHPLRILDLECSPDANPDVDIPPGVLYEAVEGGLLGDLRSVRVSARLAWGASEKTRADVRDLLEVMEEGEYERPVGVEAEVLWCMPET
ncbi:hypothetical protein BKA64DRAFT_583961 [Cadophora sp. MPI-SDFR-AT-0126]|nr:hypothetical protein BKA64DRAFT_583961 [Leotiomycetes sp. MPI-SDFR-AT-0126]